MEAGWHTDLWKLFETFRPADALDILVVSVLIYGALTWFRRARSRFVFLGLAALATLYLLARLLDMYVTLSVFQGGITVALVALVVIFQEDVRRGFERLATGWPFRMRPVAPQAIDSIVEAVFEMASTRTGALLVFKGQEPLERHLSGGIPLNGQLSTPLLYSLFDASSAGHDGAVVVDQGKIRKFAVHLPLSTSPDHGHVQQGTRHTAALGLSERSDALVIAVSEEKGTVSVAQGGKLEVLGDSASLKRRVENFLEEESARYGRSGWRHRLVSNTGTKILAIGLATLAWLVFFGQQSEIAARTFSVPVVYRKVPEGWMLEEPRPYETRITLSGPKSAFELLDPGALVVALDVSDLRRGAQRLSLHEQDVEGQGSLEVHQLQPRTVRVLAHPTVVKEVTVKPRAVGSLPHGLEVQDVITRPETVRIKVRRSLRHALDTLHTEPVNLPEIAGSTTMTVGLRVPEGARLVEGEPSEVEVQVQVKPEHQSPATGGAPKDGS